MQIEKNVPIPCRNGKYKTILSQMEKGDSVLCNTAEAQGMHMAGKTLNIKIVSRAEGALRRVWRIS